MSLFRNLFAAAAVCSALPAVADDAPTPIEPEAVALGRPVDYAQDVAPILEANCVACHNVAIDEGGLSLEEVAAMLEGGGRGPAVVPGKPDESLLLAVAAHRREPVMPPPDNDVEAKPLTARELGLIRQWILEGAGKGQAAAAAMIAWRPLPSHLKAIRAVALSPEARFAAAARGNRIELYDLALGVPAGRPVDPNLSGLTGESGPLYPDGAADRDLIQAVAFSPDGTLLASAGYRAVKLWRRAGLGESTPLDVAGATVLAASADGTTAAVAVANEVRLVGLNDGKTTAAWPVSSKVAALAITPDGQTVAAACDDATLHVFRTAGGESPSPRTAPAPVASLAVAGERVVTTYADGMIRVWSPSADQPEREWKGHAAAVRFVRSVPGQPNAVATAGEDGVTRLWDVTTGSETRSFAHGSPVAGLAVSPDGQTIVTGGRDGAVRFWKLADGAKLGESIGLFARRRTEKAAAETLEWRKQLAAVAERRVTEAEAAVKDREEIQKKSVEAKDAAAKALEEARKADGEAAAAAKTAAEQPASTPADEGLKKQAEEAAKKAEEARQKLAAAEEALRSAEQAIRLAEDGVKTFRERLETRRREKQTADEAVAAAETAAAAAKGEADRPAEVTAVAFSPAGDRVVTCHADGTVQTFTAAGQPLDSFTGPNVVGVAAVAGDAVLTLRGDGTIHRTDVAGRWEYAGVLGPPQDAPLDLARSAFVDRVLSLAFSPDGRLLATGGGEPSRSGELMLWDVEARTPARTFEDAHSDTVQAVAFSRDGRVLATAAADKFAKTFDVETGKPLRALEGHTDHVLGVALRADGTEVATAAADLGVKVWDAESGEQRRTITGHGKQVTAVRYVGLTEQIVTAGGDGTVRLHRTSDGGHLRTFAGPADYVHSVAVSGDGATVVAGGEEGVLFVWDGPTGQLRRRIDPPQAPAQTAAAK